MTIDNQKLSREEAAAVEIGRTTITRAQQYVLALFLLTVIYTVPLVQQAKDTQRFLAGAPDRASAWPACFEIFSRIPKVFDVLKGGVPGPGDDVRPTQIGRLFDANSTMLRDINAYEDALADDSFLTKTILPHAQGFLTAALQAGNEKAYPGRGGWLFYRPDIDSLTGRGFLDEKILAARARSGSEWQRAPQPDPLIAIHQFHQQLAERGIRLVVMPTPVKPSIHPHQFAAHGEIGLSMPVHNPSYLQFEAELMDPQKLFTRYASFLDEYDQLSDSRSRCSWKYPLAEALQRLVVRQENVPDQKILYFNPSPLLLSRAPDSPQYLATDTHWRPEAARAVAQDLARFLSDGIELPPVDYPVTEETAPISNLGDIAGMLRLPDGQTTYPQEEVSVNRIQVNGMDWRSDPTSDVLLLGDSFSNIYSLEEMGWGASAGFAEQLSAALKRPVDTLIRNDAGAHATREMLSRELARGNDRLAGKRVVIWQFAERELAVGDWRVDRSPMIVANSGPGHFLDVPPGPSITVRGMVQEASPAPRPGEVPYEDHVIYLHLTDLQVKDGPHLDDTHVLVAIMSMRKNVLTPAAQIRPGREIELRLRNYEEVDDPFQVSGLNSAELDSETAYEIPVWGETLDQTTEELMEGALRPAHQIPSTFTASDISIMLAVLLVLACLLRWAESRQRQQSKRLPSRAVVLFVSGFVSAAVLGALGLFHPVTAAADLAAEPLDSSSGMSKPEPPPADFHAGCARAGAEGEGMTHIGTDGWLFLRAELRHLGKGPFWGTHAEQTSTAPRTDRRDPLPALTSYQEALSAQGIDLIFLPVPPKAFIYPDRTGIPVTLLATGNRPRLDIHHQEFYKQLRTLGIDVVDPTQSYLDEGNRSADPLYCRTDTHWSGRACVQVASMLAEKIKKKPWYAEMTRETFASEVRPVTIDGDLRRALAAAAQPAAETLSLRFVGRREEQGLVPIEPDPYSPVLVLADSHGLVFHAGDDMHAAGAGLVDQLAFELGFPVDLIAVRGSGATPARVALYRRAKKDPEVLASKKLVIWCVTAREFTETDGWAKVPLPKP
jgi:hypothetical protein